MFLNVRYHICLAINLVLTISAPASSHLDFPSGGCFVEDQACEANEDNFLDSVPGLSSVEECYEICNDNTDCEFLSYFGADSFPLQNYCMLFTTCPSLHPCVDCITEEKSCYEACSDALEGAIGENTVGMIVSVQSEVLCMDNCRTDPSCKFYTYYSSEDPSNPNTCFLLSEILEPARACTHCRTGSADCSRDGFCRFSLPDDTVLLESVFLNETVTNKRVNVFSIGNINNPCVLTLVAVGGGGRVPFCTGGAGSGYVSQGSYKLGETILISIGGPGQATSITTVSEEIVLLAEPGDECYGEDGGNGYSGGGSYGHGGVGGEDGGDGQATSQGKGGVGSAVDVSKIDMENFVVTFGAGGVNNGGCGGGGGGVLINGAGPSATDAQGQGYGGGADCQSFNGDGLPGAVLIEVK